MTQAYNLAILANAVNTSGQLNVGTNATGTLPVANGGTGQSALTANNVVLGNGTSGVQFVAPSTNGNVLTSNGTTWVSSAPSGGVSSLNGQTGAITNTGFGNIGSYFAGVINTDIQTNVTRATNTTVSGTGLLNLNEVSHGNFSRYLDSYSYASAGLSGTWRAMSRSINFYTACSGQWSSPPVLWVRIS